LTLSCLPHGEASRVFNRLEGIDRTQRRHRLPFAVFGLIAKSAYAPRILWYRVENLLSVQSRLISGK
jgi:hypothetical protein